MAKIAGDMALPKAQRLETRAFSSSLLNNHITHTHITHTYPLRRKKFSRTLPPASSALRLFSSFNIQPNKQRTRSDICELAEGRKTNSSSIYFPCWLKKRNESDFEFIKAEKSSTFLYCFFFFSHSTFEQTTCHDSPNITATPVAASRTLDRWNKWKCSRLNVYKYISLHFNAGKRECFEWIIVAMSTNIECEREATCRRRRRKEEENKHTKWSEVKCA